MRHSSFFAICFSSDLKLLWHAGDSMRRNLCARKWTVYAAIGQTGRRFGRRQIEAPSKRAENLKKKPAGEVAEQVADKPPPIKGEAKGKHHRKEPIRKPRLSEQVTHPVYQPVNQRIPCTHQRSPSLEASAMYSVTLLRCRCEPSYTHGTHAHRSASARLQ